MDADVLRRGGVPSQLAEQTGITGIGEFAFANHNITEINIPASVKTIGGYAFSGCGYLEKVNLPEGLTKISGNLFNGCGALKRIDIPTTVTEIGYCAFTGCSGLTEVHIKDMEAWCKILFDENDGSPSNPLRYAGRLYLNGELVTEVVVPLNASVIVVTVLPRASVWLTA